MADHPLRSALFNKDRQGCHDIVSSDLIGQSLVDVIYEMLFFCASVKYVGELILHPLCIINSIKLHWRRKGESFQIINDFWGGLFIRI